MSKVIRPVCMTRKIVLFLLVASLGFISLPLSSMAAGQREHFYSNCAELQKYLNDKHPEDKYEGYEKVEMIRIVTAFNRIYGGYHLFCNGGINTTREPEGIMVCKGFIRYSYSRYDASSDYYIGWGLSKKSSEYDYEKNNYCRWKEKFRPIYEN